MHAVIAEAWQRFTSTGAAAYTLSEEVGDHAHLVSRIARLPSSPPDTISFEVVSKARVSIAFDELWWILVGSCHSMVRLVATLAGRRSASDDSGQTTACPSVPAVQTVSGAINKHCVKQDVK